MKKIALFSPFFFLAVAGCTNDEPATPPPPVETSRPTEKAPAPPPASTVQPEESSPS
jgi:hypothetical protein